MCWGGERCAESRFSSVRSKQCRFLDTTVILCEYITGQMQIDTAYVHILCVSAGCNG